MSSAALQSFLQSKEGHLSHPLDGHTENSILAFAGQGHLQLGRFVADGEWVTGVEVASAVKDGLAGAKDFAVSVHHGLDDVSVDLPWALVRLNRDLVVMDIATGHGNLEMIGSQHDGTAFSAEVWSSGASEAGSFTARGRWIEASHAIATEETSNRGDG